MIINLPDKQVHTVSELTGHIKRVLEEQWPVVWVSGEISNFVQHSSGHMYMTLKDAGAQIRLVVFAGVNRRFKFSLTNGLEVIVSGQLSVYDRSGQYQIIGQHVEPKGLGALQLAFEQLKEKLAKEGLFDAERKKELPLFPQRIGVVTSPTGAAVRDILQITGRRYPLADVVLCPVRVQGQGAAEEIAQAIDNCNRYGALDVLIVGRGGGSLEDLWAFNEEVVARSIARSRIPVVSAVGHEIDFTISDFVADLRAPTPSAAAEIVVPDIIDLKNNVDNSHRHLRQHMAWRMDRCRHLLQSYRNHYVFRDQIGLLRQFQQRRDDLEGRLLQIWSHRFGQAQKSLGSMVGQLKILNPAAQLTLRKEQFHHQQQRLQKSWQKMFTHNAYRLDTQKQKLGLLSPLNVLSRGYSITFDAQSGDVIKSVHSVLEGMPIRIQVGDGTILSDITHISPDPSLTQR